MHPSSYPSTSDNHNAGFQQPTLPFGSPRSPYHQLPDYRPFPQHPDSPSIAYPPLPYSPSNMGHNLRTNYTHPFPFHAHAHAHSPEGAPGPYSTALRPYSQSPHQSSPPQMQMQMQMPIQIPAAYPAPAPTAAAFHPMNYSPPVTTTSPPYGYPPPQAFSPPHPHAMPVFPQYQAPSSAYQPQFSPSPPDQDRGGPAGGGTATWWYNVNAQHAHAPVMSQQHFNGAYQDNYQAKYAAGRQSRDPHPLHPSASVPLLVLPTTHPTSPTSPSLERRPSTDAASAPSTSSKRPGSAAKPLVRRPYHPTPAAHPGRSEWVLWAGNVPSDATHDELWRLFTAFPDPSTPARSGVLSVFLIARSC
ncbi:hypothetical protein H0H92_003499, partial [Tricholoma furcatifolium]